ncbi:MbnP family copper-binding protein [Pseudogemmobacter faecipullorum]|uniref:Metallo-mystery pair system four-Cys motif protein n=1 Tax=Pseudogemmobacter faecipullorum TaxID=2755041 RepID=A0ABS8CSC8_9RHOB|nr:MbnP family copper-binding protein [Pseudogemmobacter faecipullorum]MCB5412308.1 metallo-mystery pair system four-Cys motif protein [Pseudogemmobacter faecipullorum]
MSRSLLATAALLLATPALAEQPVNINFAAEIGGAPFACGQTYDALGATGASVTGIDYRLFVSDAALVRADGSLQPIALEQDGKWQLDTLALLDFEDGTQGCSGTGNADLNTSLHGTVPAGDYVGLTFTLGVPFGQNHIDPTLAAAPLNTTGMFWNWQNGFRFVRIDMVPTDRAEDGPKGWFLHLGSTQCAAESKTEAPSACTNPNRVTVTFPGFDPATNTVVIDPAPVVAGADLRVNAPDTSPGCMSFPGDADCTTVMSRLGLPFDGIAAGAQQLLSVR